LDPRAKPRAAGRLKGKRRDNRDEPEFYPRSRKRRQLLYCPSLERNLSDCQQETSQKRTSGPEQLPVCPSLVQNFGLPLQVRC
jgi:hypothetical protein